MKNKSLIKQTLNSAELGLLQDVSLLIEKSKQQMTVKGNEIVNVLFWTVGERINCFVLDNKRAEYGKQIVVTVSRELEKQYGRNFEEKNLRRMMQFAEQFEDKQIVVTVSRQLTWSHILALLPLKTVEAKLFYTNQVAEGLLSVRELRKSIKHKSFERRTIANTQIANQNKALENTFKNPYFLDFLGLKDTYLEKDLEASILHELESFILELGKGFTFVERQKRMIIDGEDFNLDLLFYHRKLKRLVAIDLKIDKFHAKFKGQMELYLKWLDKHERQEGEHSPIGLILCAESSREQVELLEVEKSGIMVAEYWTELPPQEELENKLHELLIEARNRIEQKKLDK